jgi:hypothetical protein
MVESPTQERDRTGERNGEGKDELPRENPHAP